MYRGMRALVINPPLMESRVFRPVGNFLPFSLRLVVGSHVQRPIRWGYFYAASEIASCRRVLTSSATLFKAALSTTDIIAFRVYCAYQRLAILPPHCHVAGKQQAQLFLDGQGFVRELRIASA